MLSAIREIGKWQIKKSDKDELDVLIREPNFKEGGRIVFIKVNIDNKTFEGVELEDYDSAKKHEYLFRGGVSQGPNATPIANIPNAKKGKNDEESRKNLETQLRKTFDGKIQKWFDKYSTGSRITEKDNDFLKNIKCILSSNQDQIIQSIQSCIADIPKKEGKLLTVKIKVTDEWKYIGDLEIFKNSLKEIETQKITGVAEKDKNCSICGVQKAMVSGDTGVFKFYTIDKPGFITGGFKEQFAWRNFPVCPQCKLELEEGRKFIDKNSTYKFYIRGLRYLLIPKLLVGGSDKRNEIINILTEANKTVSLKERVKKNLTDAEDEILDILADQPDKLTLNFLFLSKEQSAERIMLLIEDVFPSRIRRIFEAKDIVDSITDDSFTFRNVREFFSKSDENKRNYDLDKYFLDIVDKVFRGTMIDFPFLMRFFMTKIQKGFVNYDSKGKERYNFHSSIKSALMNTIFFERLGLITFEEVKDMEESIFEEVFKKYGNTFASPVRRGLFLAGALTQMLLNKQGKERGAKPFMKKLKGLKMDERDIKALLPAVQNKFEEYNSFHKAKRLIAEEAYDYLFASGDSWRLTVDELNFYFTGGMNLVNKIKDILYAKGEKDLDIEEDISAEEVPKE